ncbi:MAG: Mrp protein [Clostridiaceae bacterium]|jgi:Mrp family chromosome partitioning ATPase|nr:Mrp protein [Clostridiaceae bacterium]
MSKCDNCASKGSCNSKGESCSKIIPKYGRIKHILGVISGKGGVGKSTVSAMLAVKLKKAGYSVGILDGDITGPSIPRIFNVNKKRAEMVPVNNEQVKFMPVETELGIKIISLNLLTEEEEQPVIWRGPVITGVLTQMYTDTVWDELDYLIIDMPPGTGDIALTIMQSLPVESMIVVSTPQDMVSMIVKKVVIMAEKMNVKISGVVENMSYVQCGNCGEKMRIFSKRSAEEQAEYLGIPLLEELPIDLDLVENLENGNCEDYIANSKRYSNLFHNFIYKK